MSKYIAKLISSSSEMPQITIQSRSFSRLMRKIENHVRGYQMSSLDKYEQLIFPRKQRGIVPVPEGVEISHNFLVMDCMGVCHPAYITTIWEVDTPS